MVYYIQLVLTNSLHMEDFIMNLTQAQEGIEYIIKAIETNDEEMDSFLFSLGCYVGEPITVIFKLKGSVVVAIKDGRYNFDNNLAKSIVI